MAGYSGTPLATKLGIKPAHTVLSINAPKDYRGWLGDLPDVTFVSNPPRARADMVHLFVTSLAELEKQLPRARLAMKSRRPLGLVAQKSAKIPTDVTEDAIRGRAPKTDLVDVKVCAVSDEWSGLKLVVRKHLR